MQNAMWITTIVLLLSNLGFLVFILKRLATKDKTQDELLALRELVANLEKALGEEVPRLEKAIRDEVRASQETTAKTLTVQLGSTADTLTSTVGKLGEAQTLHLETVKNSVDSTAKTLVNTVGELGQTQARQLEDVKHTINALTQTNETSIEKVRNTLTEELQAVQTSNENKLELIRVSVNEQLQTTADTLTSTVGKLGEAQTLHLETVKNSVDSTAKTLVNTVGELGQTQARQLEAVQGKIDGLTQANETSIENVRNTLTTGLKDLQTSNENKLELIRQSVNKQLQTTADTLTSTVGKLGEAQTLHLETVKNSVDSTAKTLVNTVGELGKTQTRQLEDVQGKIDGLTQANETSIEKVRNTLTTGLKDLQTSNENKLELIRQTVDEQLQSTLERRIGKSFNLVSTQLAEVERGLGEMRNLATGVEDFRKLLLGDRTRGIWGEVQLGGLLEQILTPDQYDTNVRIKANSREAVEFAIRLPGNDKQPGSYLWLPIDSKFPTADYQRLVDATDVKTEEALTKKFIRTVESEARKIRDKYIVPPVTTDFAIMFLPTEGLYAEVLRQPGQVEKLQTEYRIVVAGPTTLTAILSSLRLGFRTLAIQKHSSEVWKLLAAVKTEFGKFENVFETLKKQLHRAYNTINVETGKRVQAINNKLQAVEELPLETAAAELGISNEGQIDKGDADE